MLETDEIDGLAGSLMRLAADPARIQALYKMLGEYCHLVRNRLNCVKLGLYLARRDSQDGHSDRWIHLDQLYGEVEAFVDRFQTVCRPFQLAPMKVDLGSLLEERRPVWDGWLSKRGRWMNWRAPATPAVGRFDVARLSHGLDALAMWRAETGPADTPVRVSWKAQEDRLNLSWEEAGPWCADDQQSTGLVLPLLARLVSAHGGSLRLSLKDGLHLRLSWPTELGECAAT
jgi:hypothetical protein